MNPTKPNDATEEQTTNQNQQPQANGPVQGPEAASKRDVEEAEAKAEAADKRAGEAKRMAAETAAQAREDVQEEIDRVEEKIDRTVSLLDQLNANLEAVIDNTGSMSGPSRHSMDEYEPVDCTQVEEED